MTDAVLTGAKLSRVDFRNANMTGVVLEGADLDRRQHVRRHPAWRRAAGRQLEERSDDGADLMGAVVDGDTLSAADGARNLPQPAASIVIADMVRAHELWIGTKGAGGQAV